MNCKAIQKAISDIHELPHEPSRFFGLLDSHCRHCPICAKAFDEKVKELLRDMGVEVRSLDSGIVSFFPIGPDVPEDDWEREMAEFDPNYHA